MFLAQDKLYKNEYHEKYCCFVKGPKYVEESKAKKEDKGGKEGVTVSKAGRVEKFNRKYGLNKESK